ncbi:MAG: hypothetical protein AB7I79_07095 [Rhizobiaceae bacterium]
MRNPETSIPKLRGAIAAERFRRSAERLRLALRYNPYWRLQPRVPAGMREGGQWLAGVVGAAVGLLPALARVGGAALRRLRETAMRTSPRLRSVPRRWERDQPREDTYDEDTRRISSYSSQRPDLPILRFRSEAELRRYLGPAGAGREWHHIVEKRMAGREGFPAELIHSTDNIINLPVEVHRQISARMSTRDKAYQNNVRRFGMETRTFAEQYDAGLDLAERTLREFGYDPQDF